MVASELHIYNMAIKVFILTFLLKICEKCWKK